MSGLSLSDLLEAQAAPFEEAGQAWLAVAEALDNGFERLLRGTRDLQDGWPEGAASAAGLARLSQVRGELNGGYDPARRIGQALLHHGAAVVDLREQVRDVAEGAAKSGYVVDLGSGTVTPVADRYTDAAAAQAAGQGARQIVDTLADLLSRARSLDDSTAETIRASLPAPGLGFGALDSVRVPREALLAQQGRTPAQVNAWWNGLTPAQQEQAIADFPELVGWLNGVPATDRDTANRLRLGRDTTRLEDERRRLDAEEARIRDAIAQGRGADLFPGAANPLGAASAELDRIEAQRRTVDGQLAGLRKVDAALDRLGGKGMLLGVDPAGDGKAIISVGNPDTAAHTGVWVPGLGTELTDTVGNVDRVRNLQKAADDMTAAPGDVATIMWLGYDAPELDWSVVGSERSRQGGVALDGFVDGLRATHDGDGHITALGHSYGSTVVAEAALRGDGMAVDDIVTAGSPGMHTGNARDFVGINAQHVWAGSAVDDPVSNASGHPLAGSAIAAAAPFGLAPVAGGLLAGYEAGHGESPHRAGFGANQYVVDTHGHSDYWREGSQSLDNQARVIAGQYDQVGLVHGQVPTSSADEPPLPRPAPAPAPPAAPQPAPAPGVPSPAPGPAPRPPS